jgi:hypothetical protein
MLVVNRPNVKILVCVVLLHVVLNRTRVATSPLLTPCVFTVTPLLFTELMDRSTII